MARNRRRILDAAAEVFAERGLKARLDEIARRAEVGVGTVYRHFEDREGLVRALFEHQFDEVVAIGERALEHPDPWDGFEDFMTRMVEVHARSRGVREHLFGASLGDTDAVIERGHALIGPIARDLVARAQAAGSLRADVVASDIPLLQVMIGDLADHTRTIDPDVHRRLLTIVLDGLRTARDAPSPLPASAISEGDALSVLARSAPAEG